MPTLVLENVPTDVYERLRQLAAASDQPIATEAVQQLQRLLPAGARATYPAPPTRDLTGPEGEDESEAKGYVLLPDPPLDTGEMAAPCDLPFLGIGKTVKVEDISIWLPDPPLIRSELH
jgi:hypothetical protein